MHKFLATLFILVSFGFAIESKGFMGVDFGASKTELVEEILKQGYSPQIQAQYITIPVYKMGDLLVEVVCRFNQQGKFYSYEVRTGAVESERFSKVLEAAEYLSKQFSGLFGQPTHKNQLRIEDVAGKKAAPFALWGNKDLDLASFIRVKDSRYYCQGVVTHKIFALTR